MLLQVSGEVMTAVGELILDPAVEGAAEEGLERDIYEGGQRKYADGACLNLLDRLDVRRYFPNFAFHVKLVTDTHTRVAEATRT